MNKYISKAIGITLSFFLGVFSFGTIIREDFFRTNNEGSVFTGFIYPIKYKSTKIDTDEEAVSGFILKFKDRNDTSNQENEWIMRTLNKCEKNQEYKICELNGNFNFHIEGNELVLDLKPVRKEKLQGKEVANYVPTMERFPVFRELAKKITPVSGTGQIPLQDGFWNKKLVFIHENYIEKYICDQQLNVALFKETLASKPETCATAYRLSNNPEDYIVGSLGRTPDQNEKTKKDKFTPYLVDTMEFVFLEFAKGVSVEHERY